MEVIEGSRLIGQSIAGYDVLAELGAGGMGVVYKARHIRLERLVALKLLPPEQVADESRRRRFLQEARAASALNHPGIVTIHDVVTHDGADVIVMELIEGEPLGQRIPPGACPGARRPRSPSRSPRRWPPPTPPASSTATSSPPTSW